MTVSPVDFTNALLKSRRLWVVAVVLMLATGFSCWVGLRDDSPVSSHKGGRVIEDNSAVVKGDGFYGSGEAGVKDSGRNGSGENDGRRPTREVRVKPEDPSPVMTVLVTGDQNVKERVRQLQTMRGTSFSDAEREAALGFLTGRELPEGMGRGSVDWLSDELLTTLRLQEPPWDGLAAALAGVAFQPETNPVTRDYIMQHLGHYWEQYGAREEIEDALWRAVGTADGTTPGTALIALSRGYQRDQQEVKLQKVQHQALELARNPDTGLAVRVTALAIAGEGGGREVKELAIELLAQEQTPVILRKVAERLAKE